MSSIFLQQAAEFFTLFFRFGGTVGMVKRLLTDSAFMRHWVKSLIRAPEFAAIHDVYTPQLAIVSALLACGVDIKQFTWIGSMTAPKYTDDPEVVVVLDITLGTLKETFIFACEWMYQGGGYNDERLLYWDGSAVDAAHLRLLQGSEPFQPYTLRWRRIKLDANRGKKPTEVRNPRTSPGIVLIFLAAQHPIRMRASSYDHDRRWNWQIPGIEFRDRPDGEAWDSTFYVHYDMGEEISKVFPNSSEYPARGTDTVPVFDEE